MGKLIVIEGSDGSGKATQSKLLYDYLTKVMPKGTVLAVSYPDYESNSSALTKMYLGGELGTLEDVNPYVASSFYAVDRFASYLRKWKDFYKKEDSIVICDRYVTSNMLHQSARLQENEKETFLKWEYDFEYIKGGLPVPDTTIFLDVPPATSIELMENRENKITHEKKKDIHESNPEFLKKSYANSFVVSEMFGWRRVNCVDEDGKLKSIEDIHKMVLECLDI